MSDSIIFLFINNQHGAHNLVSWAFDCDQVGLSLCLDPLFWECIPARMHS